MERLLPEGGLVTCALSGGADSVALLHVLRALSPELGITLRAAHFNHQLRGAESDEDEVFVRSLCERWSIPLTVGRGDVRALAETSTDSVEEAARRARYAFFDTLPGFVATAHTADDNLETLLINLLRGTSLAGLGGIPPKRGKLLRPMLGVSHQQVLAYLAEHDLPHREDGSNQDRRFLRNRLRLDAVPLLKAENPRLLEQVQAMTSRLRADEALLSELADQALERARSGDGYDCAALAALPDPLLQRSAIRLLSDLPDRSAAHVEALCRLIRSENPSAQIDLPGGRAARRVYGLLLMDRASSSPIPRTFLSIPGETRIGTHVIRVARSETPLPGAINLPDVPELFVRSREPGDVIRLPGGSRTLHKLLIDRKVPAADRDSVPVLCTADGPAALLGVPNAAPPCPEQGPYLTITYKE